MVSKLLFLCLVAFLHGVETISVIVPCHPSHFPLLEELLTAYAEQTLIPNEVVISLSEYEKVAPASIAALEKTMRPFKLILLKHPKKHPAATNRKLAVQASRGDLLIFQDADDLPHPQRVEIVKYIFEHHQIHHLIHSFVSETQEFPPYSTDSIPLIRSTSDLLICGLSQPGKDPIPLHHGNICVSRIATVQGQWKPTYEAGEDLHFNIATLAFFPRTCYATPLKLIRFRSHLSYFSNTPPELR
jgi:glycosyltransferase involved in cell wall biosynthesis